MDSGPNNNNPKGPMALTPIKMRVNPPNFDQGSNRKQLLSSYSVRFSPFEQTKTRLVVANSKHFGMIGGGSIHILDMAAPAEDV